jgi:hypothetical protein
VGLAMENLGIFYDHLVYFTAIGNILLPFGIFCGNLVKFFPFWYFGQEKSGNPGLYLNSHLQQWTRSSFCPLKN